MKGKQKRGGKYQNRYNSTKNHNKPKEVEENVPQSSINKADLPRDNDPAWYMLPGQIAIDAGDVSYSQVAGLQIPLSDNGSGVHFSDNANVVPGVLALKYLPTIGEAINKDSAVNVTSKALYAYIRSKISGSRPYDDVDVMMYDIAMDSAFIWWSEAIRVYGLVRQYSVMNRYYPQTVVEACGYDFQNILDNLPQFRQAINTFAYQLSALCVPAAMTYNIRHAWMSSNVFTDANSVKAQTYLYRTSAIYVYVEGDGNKPPYLSPRAVLDGITVEHWKSVAAAIVQPLLGSNDIGTISGDILRTFGDGALLSLRQMEENYFVQPIYSQEVLSQIENAHIAFNAGVTDIEQNIAVNQGYLTQQLSVPPYALSINPNGYVSVYADNRVFFNDQILNSHLPKPTPGDNFVATRLMIGGLQKEYVLNSEGTFNISAYGTEVINKATIYSTYPIFTNNEILNFATLNVVDPDAFDEEIIHLISALSAFDWAPRVYVASATQPESLTDLSGITEIGNPICDLDNFTRLSPTDLKNMHSSATISLFYIPGTNLKL